jgi:hypothetical protein
MQQQLSETALASSTTGKAVLSEPRGGANAGLSTRITTTNGQELRLEADEGLGDSDDDALETPRPCPPPKSVGDRVTPKIAQTASTPPPLDPHHFMPEKRGGSPPFTTCEELAFIRAETLLEVANVSSTGCSSMEAVKSVCYALIGWTLLANSAHPPPLPRACDPAGSLLLQRPPAGGG